MAAPAGSSTLVYNGITITNCLTKQFHQEPVYDRSGTDVLYQKFVVRVSGVLHAIAQSGTGAASAANVGIYPNNTNIVTAEISIRQSLMDPRKSFSYSIAQTNILQAVAAGVAPATSTGNGGYNGIDLNNGPKPRSLELTKIAGTGSFLVEYEIEVCLLDCNSSTNSKGILNNRWGFTEYADENSTWTRTYSGVLRIANWSIDPDVYRSLVVPPLAQGFKRTSMRFNTSPDMLTMEYEITDTQVQAAAPYPALTWSGRHEVETPDGVAAYANVSLRLRGKPGVDKTNLIALAMQIISYKLRLQAAYPPIVIAARIVDVLEEPSIEAHARVLLQPVSPAQYLNVETSGLGSPLKLPGYNFMQSTTPANYAPDSPAALFVCYMQSRCDNDHSLQGDTTNGGGTGGQASSGGSSSYYPGSYQGPTTTTSSSVPIPVDSQIPSNYSSAQKSGSPYTFMQIDNRYPVSGHMVQLPIAGLVSGAANQGIGYIDPGDGVPFPVSSVLSSSASQQPTCLITQLAQPTCKRLTTVTAERFGDWPDVPTPEGFTIGSLVGALNDFSLDPRSPAYQADGKTKFYSVSARYEWLLNRVPTTSEKLDVGALAYTSQTPANNLVAANQLLSSGELI